MPENSATAIPDMNRKPDADGEHRGSTAAGYCLAESTISRRSAIAAVAAFAATGSLAEAGAVDPIFPVLETFRLAQEAPSEAIKKSIGFPQGQWLTPAYAEAKLTTVPTTRAFQSNLPYD